MGQPLTDSELKSVSKPAQYLGGEIGSIIKDPREVDIRFCLAFPDTYEVGMSHIGMQILYDVLNSRADVWAERAFAPLPDMEALLKSKELPFYALESKTPLKDFDILGFSLQYELCATGVLNILDLAQIPFWARERDESYPLIIGGGPFAYHPEPVADFFDCFLVGDGEELVQEFVDVVKKGKRDGLNREALLREASKLQGVYIPAFFSPQYDNYGRLVAVTPRFEDYRGVSRRILPTLEGAPYPTKPVVPSIKAVHDRLSVEVMRGCVRGCRFCQAGYLYRPQRERKPEEILKIVEDTLPNTGYEELSLLSLSTADYCSILPLLSALKERHCENDELAISFPSTRVDALKPELLQEVQAVRRSGFTVAPEAGTQRLRDVINKGVSDEEILEMCRNVFSLGWSHIKMYFMLGLPTETDEDLAGIIDIARRTKAIAGKGQKITVSVSTHVPKPFTPFQWAEQITMGETIRRQKILFQGLKAAGVNFRYHRAFSSFLEGVFARGDRRLAKVLVKAYELGARLDGWVEEVKEEVWMTSFEQCDIDPHHYLHARSIDETLPWDHISADIPKSYFLKEWKKALADNTTQDCLTQSCSICGACDYDEYRNVLFDRKRTETRLNIVNPPWENLIETREKALLSSRNKNGVLKNVPDIARNASLATLEKLAEVELPLQNADEFGSGSKDYIESVDAKPDSLFQHPNKPVLVHENVAHHSPTTRFEQEGTANQESDVAQTLRVQYHKFGTLKFTGHLELATVFFRAARRAELPIAFSRGFNPKPRFSFGPPLQLGIESTSEFVDIQLTQTILPKDLIARFNATLPLGLKIVAANEIQFKSRSLQATIEKHSYCATVSEGMQESLALELAPIQQETIDFQAKSVTRPRKGKRDKVIPLGEVLTDAKWKGQALHFTTQIKPDGSSVKPYEVVTALTGLDAQMFDIIKTGVAFVE
ncbi:MAG: TIGR03960 family B12-binding radical SAM protein [Bdellovibrionales bacterium]|nr:TIGR03960 family B12-binding radical SAM protein [Bdellovibrionales bacterium]